MDKHLHIISRKKAKELGMSEYFTGKPCKRGNIAVRYTNNAMCRCEPCAKRHSDGLKKWRDETGFDDSEYQQTYYQNNARKRRAATKEWRKSNLERARTSEAHKRHTRRSRSVAGIDCPELMSLVMSEARQQCLDMKELTGMEFHIDHMLPLKAKKVSGLHCVANLQCIPAHLNYAKRNKMIYTEPFEWTKYLEGE